MTIKLEHLELIPELLQEIVLMREKLDKYLPTLTSKKEVAKFLGKSERTVNYYMEQGLLKENIHYHRKNGKILVFIEDAILKFKEDLDRGIVNAKATV